MTAVSMATTSAVDCAVMGVVGYVDRHRVNRLLVQVASDRISGMAVPAFMAML
jgi:hypothetical protein